MGSIQNSHYLGITAHSVHKDAAKVMINFMISPEAQLQKMDPTVWGDGTVLAIEGLPADWQEKLQDLPGRTHAPSRTEINQRALMEPAPEYMIRIFEDFRKEVIEQ